MSHTLRLLEDHEFPRIYTLMQQAFPPQEYRCYADALLLLSRKEYEILVFDYKKEISGFIAHWKLNGFLFVEHFAVSTQYRSKGFGSKMMQEYLEQATFPVILEVEADVNLMAKRRIAFYQRLGFTLSNFGYDQPCLQGKNTPIPLLLMHYPTTVSADDLQQAQREIFRVVYGSDHELL